MILERLWVRSCETVSAFLKRSVDLNAQLIRREVEPTDYLNKAGDIWTRSTKDFWDPKDDR